MYKLKKNYSLTMRSLIRGYNLKKLQIIAMNYLKLGVMNFQISKNTQFNYFRETMNKSF